MYNFLSLFSGIGGIDLAFEKAGFTIMGQVEIDPFCQRVLDKHWPFVPKWSDIRDFKHVFEQRVHVIGGGFPCQDISTAGYKRGILEGTRSGLWFEFSRIIGEIRPDFVFVENVANLTRVGGTTVLGTLAELGYDAEWGIVSARAVGANHLRKRFFLIAYPSGSRSTTCFPQTFLRRPELSWHEGLRTIEDLRRRPDLPKPLIRGVNDGIPDVSYRLRALGNAVVPQVIEPFAEAIYKELEKKYEQ